MHMSIMHPFFRILNRGWGGYFVFVVLNNRFYSPAHIVRGFMYLQRPSGQSRGHRCLSPAPRYLPLFLSRIGFGIPIFFSFLCLSGFFEFS